MRRKPSRDRSVWIRARDAHLAAHPFCEVPGCDVWTKEVNHWSNRGMGYRDHSDSNLNTMCRAHHDEFHRGRKTFARRYGERETWGATG
jgi:hypothetical protein